MIISICPQSRITNGSCQLSNVNVSTQYNTLRYATIRYDTIRYDTIRRDTIRFNAMQCNEMQCNAIQSNGIQCNATQCKAMQWNATQRNAMLYNTIQYNETLPPNSYTIIRLVFLTEHLFSNYFLLVNVLAVTIRVLISYSLRPSPVLLQVVVRLIVR